MFNPRFVGILKHPGYNDPFSAAIMAGGALIGGAMSADAAEDASRMQSDTAREQARIQKEIFDC